LFAALGTATLMLVGTTTAGAASVPVPEDPAPALLEGQTPHARIGPWLGSLYDEYRAGKAAGVAQRALRGSKGQFKGASDRVTVQAMANDAAALMGTLRAVGATQIRAVGPLISARVPVSALGRLEADPALAFARPGMARTNALTLPVHSQGVQSLNADEARREHSVTGKGVQVGTLSDSFACNPGPLQPGAPSSTLSEDLSNNELPDFVRILSEGPCDDAIDEGRAMAQIVHDVAPGSNIAFHTAFNSELDFAEGIIDLQQQGSDVIVDDVIYLEEPMFMDGMVAQATDIVTSRGVPYFSSAGNQARASYQAPWRGTDVEVKTRTGDTVIRRFHDFDPGPEKQVLQPVKVFPSNNQGFVILSFQWDQPHRSASTFAWIQAGASLAQASKLAKGSRSDLDLVVYTDEGKVLRHCPPGDLIVTCQITGDRNLDGDAVDLAAIYYAGTAPRVFYVALVKRAGPEPELVKYVWFEDAGSFAVLEHDTHSGSAYGHANSKSTISVGAASWYATVPFSTSGRVPPNDAFTPKIDLSPCAPACLNDFSSAGNIPILFDRFGNRLAKREHRRNPSVTGPDGGNSTFFFSDSSYDDDDHDGRNSPFSIFISAVLDRPGDEWPNFFGTSASAPHVAAVAALMRDLKGGLTPAAIRRVLENTARPISKRFTSNRPILIDPIHEVGPDGYDFDSGFGLVDARKALNAVAAQ
jgi:hypothetical protein